MKSAAPWRLVREQCWLLMPPRVIEAQTLANLFLALDHDLEILPVINKIDLPSARFDEVSQEIEALIGIEASSILPVSAKSGLGVDVLLETLVKRIPPPKGDPTAPLRALIFDSHYDAYKGVVAYVRVVDGVIKQGGCHSPGELATRSAADGDRVLSSPNDAFA